MKKIPYKILTYFLILVSLVKSLKNTELIVDIDNLAHFNKLFTNNNNIFALFYIPLCSYSADILKIFRSTANIFLNSHSQELSDDIIFLIIDSTLEQNTQLAEYYNVQAYPKFIFINKPQNKVIYFDMDLTKDDFLEFMENNVFSKLLKKNYNYLISTSNKKPYELYFIGNKHHFNQVYEFLVNYSQTSFIPYYFKEITSFNASHYFDIFIRPLLIREYAIKRLLLDLNNNNHSMNEINEDNDSRYIINESILQNLIHNLTYTIMQIVEGIINLTKDLALTKSDEEYINNLLCEHNSWNIIMSNWYEYFQKVILNYYYSESNNFIDFIKQKNEEYGWVIIQKAHENQTITLFIDNEYQNNHIPFEELFKNFIEKYAKPQIILDFTHHVRKYMIQQDLSAFVLFAHKKLFSHGHSIQYFLNNTMPLIKPNNSLDLQVTPEILANVRNKMLFMIIDPTVSSLHKRLLYFLDINIQEDLPCIHGFKFNIENQVINNYKFNRYEDHYYKEMIVYFMNGIINNDIMVDSQVPRIYPYDTKITSNHGTNVLNLHENTLLRLLSGSLNKSNQIKKFYVILITADYCEECKRVNGILNLISLDKPKNNNVEIIYGRIDISEENVKLLNNIKKVPLLRFYSDLYNYNDFEIKPYLKSTIDIEIRKFIQKFLPNEELQTQFFFQGDFSLNSCQKTKLF